MKHSRHGSQPVMRGYIRAATPEAFTLDALWRPTSHSTRAKWGPVVASGAPLGKSLKSQTGRLNALDIGQGAVVAALPGDRLVEVEQIGLSLRRDDDLVGHLADFSRFSWWARRVWRTRSAGIARDGSTCMAS
jgi:hypothetical protein